MQVPPPYIGMYQAQQDACNALLHGDLMAQAEREEARRRNMVTQDAMMDSPTPVMLTSYICRSSDGVPTSRLQLLRELHDNAHKPLGHARAPEVCKSPKQTRKKGKKIHAEGPTNAMPTTPFLSTQEYAKLLRQHSLDIIKEANEALLAGRKCAEDRMQVETTEPRFSPQEVKNLDSMYLASVQAAARKKKFEQEMLNGTFIWGETIEEANEALLAGKKRAEDKMQVQNTEPRFSPQEVVNLDSMYLASVQAAARKQKFEQDILNGTFIWGENIEDANEALLAGKKHAEDRMQVETTEPRFSP